VVPRVYSGDPKGSMTSSQGIRGHISVITTLKSTYFLNQRKKVFVKSDLGTFLIGDVFILYGC